MGKLAISRRRFKSAAIVTPKKLKCPGEGSCCAEPGDTGSGTERSLHPALLFTLSRERQEPAYLGLTLPYPSHVYRESSYAVSRAEVMAEGVCPSKSWGEEWLEKLMS